MRVLLRSTAVLLVVLPAVACGGAKRPPAPRPTESKPASASAAGRPRVALARLARAAGAGDFAAMWATLSVATQRTLGPTLDGFRAHSAHPLERQLAPFAHGGFRVFLEEQTDLDLAVAGISRGASVYAAAFRLERGGWFVVDDPSLRIKATLPRPGSRIYQRTKVLAEVTARGPVTSASVWFDGLVFPAEGATIDPEHAGVLGEAPQPLRSGRHTVVAFATTDRSAAARAWSFTSYGGPYRGSLAPNG